MDKSGMAEGSRFGISALAKFVGKQSEAPDVLDNRHNPDGKRIGKRCGVGTNVHEPAVRFQQLEIDNKSVGTEHAVTADQLDDVGNRLDVSERTGCLPTERCAHGSPEERLLSVRSVDVGLGIAE